MTPAADSGPGVAKTQLMPTFGTRLTLKLNDHRVSCLPGSGYQRQLYSKSEYSTGRRRRYEMTELPRG
ncbi:hypothetical protein ACFL3W_01995 [Pseudomonadota bacterium]